MRRSIYIGSTLVVGILAAGALMAGTSTRVTPAPAAEVNNTTTTQDAVALDSAIEIRGWSTTRRTANGVATVFHAAGLVPGNLYTVRAVTFDAPDECLDVCGQDDLHRPNVEARIQHVAGNVASKQGTTTFLGQARVDVSPAADEPVELLLVVRDHGAPIAGQISEQLLTDEGGCADGPAAGSGDGENPCRDVLLSTHVIRSP